MALLEETAGDVAVATCLCPDGTFPSVGRVHAPALRLERTIQDLFGLTAAGLPDERPWLDHGRWGISHPLASPPDAAGEGAPYAFLRSEGEGLHQIPVGPVHAGIIEPGHFRFTANGETIVRLEAAPGLRPQGDRIPDVRRFDRSKPPGSPAAPPATARWLMRLRSRVPSRRRSARRCRPARCGCAR